MAISIPARSATGPAAVLRASVRWSRGVAVLAVGFGLFGLVGFGLTSEAGRWPASVVLAVAGAGFVLGIPHGAVDHVLVSRLSGRSVGSVTALYAAVVAVVWVLLRWTGPVALVAVVLLSMIHFGLGELEVHLDGWRPGPAVSVAVAIAATGSLMLPLARSGPEIRDVAIALSPELGELVVSGPVRAAMAVFWFVAAAVAGVAAIRAGRRGLLWDIALVGALGAVLPPLVAFGVWFGGWHALRHGARLLTVEPACASLVAAGRSSAAVWRLVRLAAVPSLVAMGVLSGAATLAATGPDLSSALAEALRLLLALTVPHMLVVLWLDRRGARV